MGPPEWSVRPWPRLSGMSTRNRTANSGRWLLHMPESTMAPCTRTRGSPWPCSATYIRSPFTDTKAPCGAVAEIMAFPLQTRTPYTLEPMVSPVEARSEAPIAAAWAQEAMKPALSHQDVLFGGLGCVTQRTQLAANQWLGQLERVASKHVDVLKAERPGPLDVFGANLDSHLLDLRQRTLDVTRVPKNDGVDHQTERSKLVLLAFAVALPKLTALAVGDGA